MKHFLYLGIGDGIRYDSILTQEERNNITEIYWACRFGKNMAPLFENNHFYPNLTKQYFIDDETGRKEMDKLYPGQGFSSFWHFRSDIQPNFNVGLSLFGLKEHDVIAHNVPAWFRDPNRKFINSSFLNNAKRSDTKLKGGYILVHYPTSTRPRQDIAPLNDADWRFIGKLSKENSLKVVVITDIEIQIDLPNTIVLLNPNIKSIVALCKFAKFYVGCDSFCSILCAKTKIPPSNIFIKSNLPNVEAKLLSEHLLPGYFAPHIPETITQFYKPYLG